MLLSRNDTEITFGIYLNDTIQETNTQLL